MECEARNLENSKFNESNCSLVNREYFIKNATESFGIS
jgi:hypothetical protein